MRLPLHSLPAIALLAAICAACGTDTTKILPPPFGPHASNPGAPRLFYPTGLAVSPSGQQLLVANGNFDHTYDFGTISSLDVGWLQSYFATSGSIPCNGGSLALPDPLSAPFDAPPVCVETAIAPTHFQGSALIGSYAGPLLSYTKSNGTAVALTTSRDSNLLHGARINADGSLSCIQSSQQASSDPRDCRNGLADLYSVSAPDSHLGGQVQRLGILSPFGLAYRKPDPKVTGDQALVYVGGLAPIITNDPAHPDPRSRVGVLRADDPSTAVYGTDASDITHGGGIGTGQLLFDDAHQQLLLAGCYQRVGGSTSGAPATVRCQSLTASGNQLRWLNASEGLFGEPSIQYLTNSLRAVELTSVALGGYDSAGVPQRIYGATRGPDAMLEIQRRTDPLQPVAVTQINPLPLAPAAILRLQPPSGLVVPGDLIAIVGAGFPTAQQADAQKGTLSVYDSSQNRVVAVVRGLGDTPFFVAQLPSAPTDSTAHLAVTVFGSCSLALVDVNYQNPSLSHLRARLGSCP